uniref:WGS project CAEQ00000000 data, annotated contig 1832 n=1 Tax=Trypanosoma congolense (strain IL3000) TaxID=1068625 RepID=F9W985_TRYCI|nr:unnamed protein product [Trypanosoma congolense IL3000]
MADDKRELSATAGNTPASNWRKMRRVQLFLYRYFRDTCQTTLKCAPNRKNIFGKIEVVNSITATNARGSQTRQDRFVPCGREFLPLKKKNAGRGPENCGGEPKRREDFARTRGALSARAGGAVVQELRQQQEPVTVLAVCIRYAKLIKQEWGNGEVNF